MGLKHCPDSPGAYNNLGVIYFKKGNVSKPAHPSSVLTSYNLTIPRSPLITGSLFINLTDALRHCSAHKALSGQRHVADAHYLLGVCS